MQDDDPENNQPTQDDYYLARPPHEAKIKLTASLRRWPQTRINMRHYTIARDLIAGPDKLNYAAASRRAWEQVTQEIIDDYEQALADKDAPPQWEPVPWSEKLNDFGDYIHSGTLFVRCTTQPGTWHGYTFREGEMLMRKVEKKTSTPEEVDAQMAKAMDIAKRFASLADTGAEMTSAVAAFSAAVAGTSTTMRQAVEGAVQTQRNYVSIQELAQADEARMQRLVEALQRSPWSLEDVLRNLLSGWSYEDVMNALEPSIPASMRAIEENEERGN